VKESIMRGFFRRARIRPSYPLAPTLRPRCRLDLEELETRTLLSASALDSTVAVPEAVVQSTAQVTASTTSSSSSTPAVTNPTPPATAYTPSQVETAYGFGSLYSKGNNGAGQTIAIVDAYNDPNIVSDLAKFDAQYNLPGTTTGSVSQFLSVVNQNGSSGSLPQSDPSGGWEAEEALDVEWAHAMAPGAKIVLVEANSASLGDLFSAVQTAAGSTGASVVSMSWGGSEFPNETSYDSIFARYPNVTFVTASGDSGAGTIYPAVSPYVVAVGGTTLPQSGGTAEPSQQTGWGNGRWSYYYGGSGGGVSRFEAQPSYQSDVVTQTTTHRASPDVSYNADPNTGYAVYDSVPYYPYYPYSTYGAQSGWFQIGGTSAGAPQWSALFAIVDQGRSAASGTLGSTGALAALYSSSGRSDLQDITSGNNGYRAGPGYDLVTGLGTPQASSLAALVQYLDAAPATASVASSTTTTVHVFITRPFTDVSGGASAGASGTGGASSTAAALAAAPSGSTAATAVPSAGQVTAASAASFSLPASVANPPATTAEPASLPAQNPPVAATLAGHSAFSATVTGPLAQPSVSSTSTISGGGDALLADAGPDTDAPVTPLPDDGDGQGGLRRAAPVEPASPAAPPPGVQALDALFSGLGASGDALAAASSAIDVRGEGLSSVLRDWSLALLGIAAMQGVAPTGRSDAEAEERRKLPLRPDQQ
jgi:hypothetical protein